MESGLPAKPAEAETGKAKVKYNHGRMPKVHIIICPGSHGRTNALFAEKHFIPRIPPRSPR